MPQLDKYIFLNQIIYLSIFFFFLYVYIRKDVIPNISSLLKYRKKKIKFLDTQIQYYTKFNDFNKIIFEKKGKKLISQLITVNSSINIYFYKKINFEFIILNRVFISFLYFSDIISLYKNELESIRLESI